jgi:hypothetical protein
LSSFNYINQIEEYLKAPSYVTEERKSELKAIVRNGKSFVFKGVTAEERETFLKLFDRLIDTKPGAELLDAIVKFDKPIGVLVGSRKHCASSSSISIDLNISSYVIGIDSDEKVDLYEQALEEIIGHELLHVLHYLQKKISASENAELLHLNYDNSEEQNVITGLKKSPEGWVFDPWCENSISFALKRRMYRIFHRGIGINKGEQPNLVDRACLVPTINSFELILKKYSESLNQSQITQYKKLSNKSIRPLTAALLTNNLDVYHFLIKQKGIQLQYEDDFPSPFELLIEQKDYRRALTLAEDPRFDMHLPNQKGMTPFMIFVNHLVLNQGMAGDEKQLVKALISKACKKVNCESLSFPDGSKILSRISLCPWLIEVFKEEGISIPIKNADPVHSGQCLLEDLCNQIKDIQVGIDLGDHLEQKLHLSKYEKILSFLALKTTSLQPELNFKVLGVLAKGVVDFTSSWDEEKARECMQHFIDLGGKIKPESAQQVDNLLKGLSCEADAFQTIDFFMAES